MKQFKPDIWGIDSSGGFEGDKIPPQFLESCLKYELARESKTMHRKAKAGELEFRCGVEYHKSYFPRLNWLQMREKTKKYEMVNISKSPLSKNKKEYDYFNSPVKIVSLTELPSHYQDFVTVGIHHKERGGFHSVTTEKYRRKINKDGKEIILLQIDWTDYAHIPDAIAQLRPDPLEIQKIERRGKSAGSASDFQIKLRQLMAVRALHDSPIIKHKPRFFTGQNHVETFKKAISTVQDLFIHYWNDEIVENEVPLSCTPHRANSSLFKAP